MKAKKNTEECLRVSGIKYELMEWRLDAAVAEGKKLIQFMLPASRHVGTFGLSIL